VSGEGDVCIRGGDWTATIWPGLGGSVGSLSYRGQPVLLEDPAQPHPVLRAGLFPMVPFANRIRDGRFALPDGSTRQIDHYGLDGHGHPLHGTGWVRPWSVLVAKPAWVRLGFDHRPDRFWPWGFSATLTYSLVRLRGRIDFRAALSLHAAGPEPMPATLGLHPWFPASPGARFSLTSDRRWDQDDQGLCTRPATPAGFERAEVSALDLDSCCTGWDGTAMLELPAGRIRLASWGAGALSAHLYTPPGGARFCIEPQLGRSGAFELPPGDPFGPAWLVPGEQGLWVTLALHHAG
jgi:aldose 1-epimerase